MMIGIYVLNEKLFEKIENCFKQINFSDYKKVSVLNYKNESEFSFLFTDVEDCESEIPGLLFSANEISPSKQLTVISSVRPIMGILNFLNKNIISKENYLTISLKRLEDFSTSPCHFYIQLNDSKYLKVINKGEQKIQETVSSYKKKGVDYFYVETDDYFSIVGPLLNNSFSIENFKISPAEESHKFLDIIFETAKDLGISQRTIDSFNDINKKFEGLLKQDGELKNILAKFQKSRGTYLYSHSHLCALVGLEIMKEFSWADTKEKEKFVMASLLHDLGYTNQNSCIYEDISEDQYHKLPKTIRNDIESHVIGTLNLILKSKLIPEDVVLMVRQHHAFESFTLAKMSTNLITKNSALFILAHSFTSKFIKFSLNKKKMAMLLDEHFARFNGDSFKQVTPIFEMKIAQMLI